MEHEAAGGSVDARAIFGRSLVLSFNLAGQSTDALLHASLCLEKMETTGILSQEYAMFIRVWNITGSC